MTVILKAHGPADLLAMAPPMVGFLPRNSVVLVAFRGKRTCGAMRFDLPASGDRVVHKRVVTTIVGTANGLDHESVISCDTVQTIRATQLGRQIGFLLPSQERALTDALHAAFDLD